MQQSEGCIVSTLLSLHASQDNFIHEIINTQIYTSENLQTETIYYLIVRDLGRGAHCTHTLMLTQRRTVVRLADGVP